MSRFASSVAHGVWLLGITVLTLYGMAHLPISRDAVSLVAIGLLVGLAHAGWRAEEREAEREREWRRRARHFHE